MVPVMVPVSVPVPVSVMVPVSVPVAVSVPVPVMVKGGNMSLSDDGANMGVLPDRALGTILGAEEQPSPEERLTPRKMREKIMAQPDSFDAIIGEEGEGYENATLWLAKQFLKFLEEGIEGNEDDLFLRMVERNGERDYGFTGFMVGWANNAARYCLGKPSQSNPAIMEIDI